MSRKQLPIGISTLGEIINNNFIYVDKTRFVANLATAKYYFLSRPRRFGKSLLVDTLKQAFLGNKKLFKGLYLENNWNWNKSYPVIHLDLGQGMVQDRPQLETMLGAILDRHYKEYQIENQYQETSSRFRYLIDNLYEKFQMQVVILVDEYDKPILDNITNLAAASEIRDGLKNLYSVIKTVDSQLKLVLLTGVSKFSKVNLFSGLNNLNDITLNNDNADICGYTQSELEFAFNDYLGTVDKIKLKLWYNGYNFAGSDRQKVYNPFDILLFFTNNNQYRNYWFETGSPSFLFKLLQAKKYYLPQIENLVVGEDILNSFDLEQIGVESLLFQTGYLTVIGTTTNPFDGTIKYILNYPNHEVRSSLNNSLINYFIDDKAKLSHTNTNLISALLARDFGKMEQYLRSFFAGIPYNWHTNNNIADYEGYYCTIIYSLFNSIGITATPEEATSHGRIDLSLNVLEYYIILEFKLKQNGDAASAIKQIKDKNYADKYRMNNKPIFLVGISFDTETRNIHDFSSEPI